MDWLTRNWPGFSRRGGAPLRGRVHRVSIVAGGELSVVVRFGIEWPRARELNQGAMVEIYTVPTLQGIPVSFGHEPPQESP